MCSLTLPLDPGVTSGGVAMIPPGRLGFGEIVQSSGIGGVCGGFVISCGLDGSFAPPAPPGGVAPVSLGLVAGGVTSFAGSTLSNAFSASLPTSKSKVNTLAAAPKNPDRGNFFPPLGTLLPPPKGVANG